MKIFLSQQNYHIGNFERNSQKIIQDIETAKQQGGDLIVFSELAVCGYPPKDFLDFSAFIQQCYRSIDLIKEHADTIGVLVGAPFINPVLQGKNLFNSAYLLYEKEIKTIVHKTLLPNYDVFDEYRYFEPAYEWNVVHFKGKRLAITICEDIWNIDADPLYRNSPMDKLITQQPDIIFNLSASPFDYTHRFDRVEMVQRNVSKYQLPLVYCNTVGAQTDIVFDGGSFVMNAQEKVVLTLPYFEEALQSFEWKEDDTLIGNVQPTSDTSKSHYDDTRYQPQDGIPEIHQALLLGIRDYFQKMGFKKAIVASSGGIDSALVLALACEALGSENVQALLLPSQYSTHHSVADAEQLSKNLQNKYDIISIKEVFNAHLKALQPLFKDLPFSVAEENLQSRIRGALVMALSNKFGYVLLNTSNKSELATGYGTLYGDMTGGLSVLGDLYKTQVYALAQYINRHQTIIPENIITKAPSAELREGQKDSDSLPDYELLDAILFQYIEQQKDPASIKAMSFDSATVDKVMKLVNGNEYKRYQFCPIIRVSPKAFGAGRRLPIVGMYWS